MSMDDMDFKKSSELIDIDIEIDESSLSELVSMDQDLLKENLDLRFYMERFHLTENQFTENIGVIHEFLTDNIVCRSCTKKLCDCPKKAHLGYKVQLERDGDYLHTRLVPCTYRREQEMIIDNIFSEGVDPFSFYFNTSELLDLLTTGDNAKSLSSVSSAVSKIARRLPDKDKISKGLALFSIGETRFEDMLISYIAYFYARKGFKVVILDSYTLFSDLDSSISYRYDASAMNLNRAAKADVLILRDLREDTFFRIRSAVDDLYKLLIRRRASGKISYLWLSGETGLPAFFRKIFNHYESRDNALEIIDELFDAHLINELD